MLTLCYTVDSLRLYHMAETFSILTRGCKVNQYETQQIRELLQSYDLAPVELAEGPDLVVVNTCCVTHTASAKSRRLIRQARRHDPQAVVVCGCLPAVDTDELRDIGENVHLVRDRCDLAATLARLARTEPTTPDHHPTVAAYNPITPENAPKVKREKDLGLPREMPPLTSFQDQTRAFLKVQDGCDSTCSFCLIPTARPLVRFKVVEEIVSEAADLVAAGHREIVLTGVHIGAYGQTTTRRRHWPAPENEHLPALLDRVARLPGLSRLRLSSLDPADVTPALLDVFAAHANLLPHLHLSLQSGSDAILRRMARPYRVDDFREKVELARARLDRPAITTDIIVGFPGETDADFEETLALAREAAFAKTHVFPFSPRRGTPAATMKPKVPSQIVKARSQALLALDAELQRAFRTRFLGETAQILIEGHGPRLIGRAERYFLVELAPGTDGTNATGRTCAPGEIVAARLERNAADRVLAMPLPENL